MVTYKAIPGYEGIYEIGDDGSVSSLERTYSRSDTGTEVYVAPRILRQTLDKCGYPNVALSKNNKKGHFKVHRLVAEAFLTPVEDYNQVNHIDGDKTNNSLSNLEWVNNSQNQIHAIKTGLKKIHFGRKAPRTEYTVFAISKKSNEIVAIFTGSAEMAEKGFDYRLVSAVCLGKRKSHKGCTFFRLKHTEVDKALNK